MGEIELKENSDKYTMKLPGKSVLMFILLASGVCVVYYFTNRTDDLQYNADKKSDLVWLQKILSENKHKISRHPTGQNHKQKTKPKHHFYDDDGDDYAKSYGDDFNSDDYAESYDDDDNSDSYEDYTEYTDYDSDIGRPSKRKHRVSTPASKRVASRLKPEDAWKYVKKYRPKGHRFSHADSDEERDKSHTESGQTKLLSGHWSKETKLNKDETHGESRKQYPETSNSQNKHQYERLPSSGLQTKPTHGEYYKTTQSEEPNSDSKSNYVSTSTTVNSFIESVNTESSDLVKDVVEARTQRVKTKDVISNSPAVHGHWPLSNDAIVLNTPEKLNTDHVKTTKAPIARTLHAFNTLLNLQKSRLSMNTFDKEANNQGFKHQDNKVLKGQPGANKNEELGKKTDVAQDTSNGKDDIAELKKHMQYQEYMNVFNWNAHPKSSLKPQCVHMQTLSNYVHVCIHSIAEDPDVSARLKSQASWEFNSMRDVEIAVLEEKGTGLIDLGAGIGEYSLAVASLERHVLAVEPYQPHVDMFQSSVRLNKFEQYITLLRNVISDGNYWLSMEHRSGHINDVIFNHTAKQFSDDNVTRTITLNQMANIIPFKKAILKIDIPNFTKKALTESDKLFEIVDIKYVFTHWVRDDGPLSQFLVYFFKKLGYQPHSQLHGLQLDFEKYEKWIYPYIVWAKNSVTPDLLNPFPHIDAF